MEQNSSPTDVAQPQGQPPPPPANNLFAASALDDIQVGALNEAPEAVAVPVARRNWWRWAALFAVIAALLASGIFAFIRTRNGTSSLEIGKFNVVTIPLKDIKKPRTSAQNAQSLQINGQLQVAGSILLTPGSQPQNPQTGQLYYDKNSNHLNYYDGQQFQQIGNGSVTNNITNVTNVVSSTPTSVELQAATPGTRQIGNFNISGTGIVGTLQTTVITSDGGALYINPRGNTGASEIPEGTPATIGLNTPGALLDGPGWQNLLSGTKVTTGSVGGVAKSIAVHFTNVSPGDQVRVGLYTDDGNVPSKPGTLLATSAIATLNEGFTTITIPDVTLSPNTTYWLAEDTTSTTAIRSYDGGSQSSCFVFKPFGAMPNPFNSGGCFFDNNEYAIYLNYITGAGASGIAGQAAFIIGANGSALFQNATDSTTAFQVQNAAGTSTILDIDTVSGNIGIGKTTPAYKLDITGGDLNLSNGHSVRFGGSQALNSNSDGSTISLTNFQSGGAVSIQASSFLVQDSNATHRNLSIDSSGAATFSNKTDSTAGFKIQNAAGTSTILSVDTTAKIVTVTNLAVTGHIVTAGSTPAIAAGSAACTTPTVSLSGNDISGTITVTTGTGCATSGVLATVTFAGAFGTAPHIILTPGSAISLALGSYIDNSTLTTGSFNLGTNTTPASSTTYTWNYIALQ